MGALMGCFPTARKGSGANSQGARGQGANEAVRRSGRQVARWRLDRRAALGMLMACSPTAHRRQRRGGGSEDPQGQLKACSVCGLRGPRGWSDGGDSSPRWACGCSAVRRGSCASAHARSPRSSAASSPRCAPGGNAVRAPAKGASPERAAPAASRAGRDGQLPLESSERRGPLPVRDGVVGLGRPCVRAQWDDQDIVSDAEQLSPDVDLAPGRDKDIAVIRRGNPSSSTFALSKYLSV